MSEHDEHRQTSIALPPSGISIVRDARTVFIVVVVVVVVVSEWRAWREGEIMVLVAMMMSKTVTPPCCSEKYFYLQSYTSPLGLGV